MDGSEDRETDSEQCSIRVCFFLIWENLLS